MKKEKNTKEFFWKKYAILEAFVVLIKQPENIHTLKVSVQIMCKKMKFKLEARSVPISTQIVEFQKIKKKRL